MANNFVDLLHSNKEFEEKFLIYLFQNQDQIHTGNIDWFFDASYKILYNGLENFTINNLKYDTTILKKFCKSKNSNFDDSIISDFEEKAKNKIVENVEYLKGELELYRTRYNSLGQIEKVLAGVLDRNNFSIDKVRSSVGDLYSSLLHISGKNKLLNGDDLAENHKNVLDKRKRGDARRSLGFKIFSKYITKPCAPEEMTAIIANKGCGKSIFAKCIEERLIDDKTCVLSINLEMSEESCSDRRLCLRTGFPLIELVSLNNAEIENELRDEILKFKDDKYYLFYKAYSLSLPELDSLIYEAKQIFRSKGLLPDDEYMVVTIDLIDMMDEFGNADSPYKIKSAINKLHTITSRQKIHTIILAQANENKFRTGKIIKKPEELDYYKVGLEDIEGGAAYAARCRVVMTLTRPLQLKKRFFAEQKEQWEDDIDLINVNIVKQNDGDEGFLQFVFGRNFRIFPYKKEKIEDNVNQN